MATDPEQSTLLAYAADSSAAAVPATRGRRVGAVVVAVVLTAAVAGTRAAGSRGGFHSRAKAERLVALGGVLGAALCSWLSDATILVSATLGAWGAATALMGMGVPRWAAVAAAAAAAALGAVLQRYMGCRTRSAFESASHKR